MKRLRVLMWVLCLLPLCALAQTARLTGRLVRPVPADKLLLYVSGTVGEKLMEVAKDGTFSVDVDLLEPTRCILFWQGRAEEEWSYVLWLQPDSVSTVELSVKKDKAGLTPNIKYAGAMSAVSNFANLYYQAFELDFVFSNDRLAEFSDFAACQAFIEKTLQPIGEAWLECEASEGIGDVSGDEGKAVETEDTGAEAASTAEEAASTAEEAESAAEEDEAEPTISPYLPMGVDLNTTLDSLQALAEFSYALLAEERGQKMDSDAAFKARLAELDGTDVDQAYAISMMTQWDVAAHPKRFAPLTDEAARLRSLALFTDDEDVRNEVADLIMQDFLVRVQVGGLELNQPQFRPLFEQLKKVMTSDTYEQFVETQLLQLDHPELFEEGGEE